MNVHDYMRRLGDLLAATENIIKERDALLKQRFEVDEREENLRLKIESAWRSERDEAIRERDEARREVCEFELVNMKQAYEYATHRGWDCYKEKTQ